MTEGMIKPSPFKLTILLVALLAVTGISWMLRGASDTAETNQDNQSTVIPSFTPSAHPMSTKVQTKSETTPTPPAVPELPVIRLRYGEKVHDGLLGSYCWPRVEPDGSITTLCGDKPFLDPSTVILVSAGDNLGVEIEAHEPPLRLDAAIFQSAEQPLLKRIALGPHLATSFTVNLPMGRYIVHISGQWPEGDLYYAFKIEVV
jgi:hypothetical protein